MDHGRLYEEGATRKKQLIAHLRQAKQKGYKAMLEHDKLITY
jgi:exonuclease VII small subunit